MAINYGGFNPLTGRPHSAPQPKSKSRKKKSKKKASPPPAFTNAIPAPPADFEPQVKKAKRKTRRARRKQPSPNAPSSSPPTAFTLFDGGNEAVSQILKRAKISPKKFQAELRKTKPKRSFFEKIGRSILSLDGNEALHKGGPSLSRSLLNIDGNESLRKGGDYLRDLDGNESLHRGGAFLDDAARATPQALKDYQELREKRNDESQRYLLSLDANEKIHKSGEINKETAEALGRRAIENLKQGGVTGYDASGVKGTDAPYNFGRGQYFAARALAENLDTVGPKSGEGALRMAVGAPAGLLTLLDDPARAVSGLEEEYAKQYDPTISYEKFEERAKETGIAPYAFDLGAAVAGVGRLAGLGSAVRSGGRVNRARPKLQESAGRARTQRRPSTPMGLPPNLITVASQQALDAARRAQMRGRIKRGDSRAALDREALDAGNVTPLTVPRTRIGLGRRAKRADSQDEATLRQLKRQADQAIKELRKEARALGLTDEQLNKGPFRFAVELGIRSPQQARQVLPALREHITARRRGQADEFWSHDDLPLIDNALENADTLFDTNLARFADRAVERGELLGELTPSLRNADNSQRAHIRAGAPQGRVLGVERGVQELPGGLRYFDESVDDYMTRRDTAVEEAGLAPGGYFRHSDADRSGSLAHTLGTGARAPRDSGATSYKEFDTGRVNPAYEFFEEGLMSNVKEIALSERINGILENNVPEKLLDQKTGAVLGTSQLTRRQAERNLQRAGLTDQDLVPFNPGIVKASEGELNRLIKSKDTDLEQVIDELLEDATKLQAAESGWHLVDRAVIDNIKAAAEGHGGGVRFLRKYGKSWPSRLILGTNPTWALIQIANNALLAGLGGITPLVHGTAGLLGGGKSHKFFKENVDETRELVARMGVGAFETEQRAVRMGDSAPAWTRSYVELMDTNRSVNWARDHNPLDALFGLDRHNNRAYRQGVAYAELSKVERQLDSLRKKDQWQNMNAATVQLVGGLEEAQKIMALPTAEARMKALVQNPNVVEDLGRHTDELLGNYTRYTAKERKLLETNIMFYGFLRFSLGFALYTLPFKHPLVTNIGANLGKLQESEARRLLGLHRDDPLPLWALSNYYHRDSEGRLRETPLGRINPIMNAVTQSHGFNQVASGLASPLWTELLGQITNMDLYAGRSYRLDGETQGVGLDYGEVGWQQRLSIALGNVARWVAPVRAVEAAQFGGEPQSDNASLLTGRIPTEYVDEPVLMSIEAGRIRNEQEQDFDIGPTSLPREVVRGLALPFLSRPGYTQNILARDRIEDLTGLAREHEQFQQERRFYRENRDIMGQAYNRAARLSYRRRNQREREQYQKDREYFRNR